MFLIHFELVFFYIYIYSVWPNTIFILLSACIHLFWYCSLKSLFCPPRKFRGILIRSQSSVLITLEILSPWQLAFLLLFSTPSLRFGLLIAHDVPKLQSLSLIYLQFIELLSCLWELFLKFETFLGIISSNMTVFSVFVLLLVSPGS